MNKILNVFTIDFPYNNGEPFLKNEIEILADRFEAIHIFPMNFGNQQIIYDLPYNVVVKHINIFEGYSRWRIFIRNFGVVCSIFFSEFIFSSYRFRYLKNFKLHLNTMLHRLNGAQKLSSFFKYTEHKHLVYTYWFTQWTYIFSLINYKYKSISLFTRIHGMDVYEDQHESKNFFFPFRYFQSTQIKKVISISENGKNHLTAKSPWFINKIVVNRLGVKRTGVNPLNVSDEFVLVSCSTFQKYKRVYLIIDVLMLLNIKLRWIHFGDGEERTQMHSQAQLLPSNTKVEFKGYVSNGQLMDYYKNNPVDLFINVSETEGIPVSIMEAMSFGIPCIATNVGGVKEIVNEKCGFLIDKNFNLNDAADIILKYKINHQSEKEIIRTDAFNLWDTKFNLSKNVEELLLIIK
jgi:glycosyltransferase involved in cell wall biosynthesis